jgi:predicted ATPase
VAAEAIALCEVQGFPLWLAGARMFHAAARVADGDAGAVTDLLAALALAGETGNQVAAPALLALLAEAYATAGQLDDARGATELGLAIAAQTGQLFFDAELHRLQGEIVLKAVDVRQVRAASVQTAEECFRRALEIAGAQEVRSLELRAATSLARLWRDQGKRAAASDLLAPLYAWFTEGFDTRDLQDAKALLDELA